MVTSVIPEPWREAIDSWAARMRLRALSPATIRLRRDHRKSWLRVNPPKMRHGDADRMADFTEAAGHSLLPWQRNFLNRLEAASIDEQFSEIERNFNEHETN